MSDAAMVRAFMARLIEAAGGVDPAAALIGARLGHEVSKGSISKRQSGHLDWPLVEVMALEDALGLPVVRRWLAQTLPDATDTKTMAQGVAEVSREAGEAVAAVVNLMVGSGSRVSARKELAEARDALARLAARVEEGGNA